MATSLEMSLEVYDSHLSESRKFSCLPLISSVSILSRLEASPTEEDDPKHLAGSLSMNVLLSNKRRDVKLFFLLLYFTIKSNRLMH